MSTKKKEPIENHDEWYKELFRERRTEVPKGFKSVAEICEATGFNYSHVAKKLKDETRQGKLECVVIYSPQGRSVNYYKPIKK